MARTVSLEISMLDAEPVRGALDAAARLATEVDAALCDPEFARSSAGRHLRLALVEFQSGIAELRRGRVERR